MSEGTRSRSITMAAAATVLCLAAVALAQPAPAGDYLGQKPPGRTPELFGPGVVSTGLSERDLAISPDGNEIYYTVVGPAHAYSTIMVVRREGGRWLGPETASFSGGSTHMDIEPALSPDGKRLFFLSNRPAAPGAAPNEDIWVVDRTAAGWSEPRNLGAPVNSPDAEFFPSVTRDGTIYFTRGKKGGEVEHVYRSRLVDGVYQAPEQLPEQVNCGATRFNAFVAPDESYVILGVVGRDDAISPADYYVVFRKPDGSWHEPRNLGTPINLPGVLGYSPAVSPDGRYFFFMSQRPSAEPPAGRLRYADYQRLGGGPGNGQGDIWWVDAAVIADLMPR
ncbi:MAG: TolB family protein [Thermoanaerobaculaceae bacterium]